MGKTFTVIEIESQCFLGCEDLESIILPETIITIGSLGFQDCINLKSIKIPESVTSLGNQCFYGCTNLTSATLPTSNCTLGSYCFSKCSNLNHVDLPKDLKEISWGCFEKDYNLTSIIIPETIERIAGWAFFYCQSLKSINLPSGCSIGEKAFLGCTSLRNIDIDGDIEYGAFNSCDKDIEFSFGPNMKEISLADVSVSRKWVGSDDSGRVQYTFSYYQFTFKNSFKSLIIKDSEDPIYIKCHYYDDVFEGESKYYITTQNYNELVKSWSQDTETVYLGRNLEYEKEGPEQAIKLSLPSLKRLTIGPNISDVSQSLSFGDSLIFLKSLNLTPPQLNKEFTQYQYLFLEVEVPEESLDLYQNDPEWGKFFNIKGVNVNFIENEESLEEISRYDLNGNQVDDQYKGVVIVKYFDGSTKKVLQK